MAAPSIIKVYPNPGQTDVVLGASVSISFDQLMDTATINQSTFSLTGPGQSQLVNTEELKTRSPRPVAGREYINGIFTFATDIEGHTVASFSPTRPLRPNVTYTLLVVGASLASASGAVVKSATGEALNATNQWTFTTSDLNISIPPTTSPLAPLVLPLDPSKVKIQQKIWAVGNDLSQEIDIIFPVNIDTSTLTPEQVLLSLEPILNDPSVAVPTGLTPSVTITNNKIAVVISGWPMS